MTTPSFFVSTKRSSSMKKCLLGAALIAPVLLLSCSSASLRSPASASAKDPSDYSNLLPFDLSPGESWKGGSKTAEVNAFLANTQDVKKASEKLVRDNAGTSRSGRVFHEKSHGCLTGTLTLRDSRPQDPQRQTFRGLFAQSASFPVIARFSNGIGGVGHDADPDVRGLALKIFAGGDQPVDFLMTNATNPLGRDLQQFVDFMNAQVAGNLHIPGFVKDQVLAQRNSDELPYLRHFTRTVLGVIESPEKETYWSGHPYMLGAGSHMKFLVRPEGWTDQDQFKYDHRGEGVGLLQLPAVLAGTAVNRVTQSRNYLRESLRDRASSGPIHYVFFLQLEKDARSTPLEDALVEWRERDSPPIPVADLVLDQQEFDEAGRDAECASLRFTPGHYHPDHRPVGNIGRGRIFAYLASQMARQSDDSSPDTGIVERWRKHEYKASN
jgi:hypothetical protein